MPKDEITQRSITNLVEMLPAVGNELLKRYNSFAGVNISYRRGLEGFIDKSPKSHDAKAFEDALVEYLLVTGTLSSIYNHLDFGDQHSKIYTNLIDFLDKDKKLEHSLLTTKDKSKLSKLGEDIVNHIAMDNKVVNAWRKTIHHELTATTEVTPPPPRPKMR